MKYRFLLFSIWVATALAEPAYVTFPSDIDWVTRKSEHFQILYRRGNATQAQKTLYSAERAYKLLTAIFPEAPEKTWIVLADFNDSLNGYSLDFPIPHIVIFAAPPSPTDELSALDGWLNSVTLHEYVHTLHLYPARGFYKVLRAIFGSGVVPNGLMPRMLHEGIATYLETELTLGGRGRGPHFRAWRRKAVQANVWGTEFVPLDRVDGSEAIWPGGANAYFFGYYFYDNLWEKKGAAGIRDLTLSFASNPPYLINRPFRQVYGSSFREIMNEVFAKGKTQAQKELQTLPNSPTRYLTQTRFNKWDVRLSPDKTRIGYRFYEPQDGGTFQILDPNSGTLIDKHKLEAGPTGTLCWGKADGVEWLIYPKRNDTYMYKTNGLGAYLLEEKKFARIEAPTLDHVHRISCTDDLSKIQIYEETGGHGRIREFSGHFDKAKRRVILDEKSIWDTPEDSYANSLLARADISLALIKSGLKTTLYADRKPLLSVKANAFELRNTDQPNKVLMVADIDGVNEIWSLDIRKRLLEKRVASNGAIQSFTYLPNQGEFAVSSLEFGGYDIALAAPLTNAKPKLAEVTASEKNAVPAVALSEESEYSPVNTLLPRAWIPTLLFVPNGMQVGAWIPGFDVSQKHLYDVYGGYDTRGLAFANLSYSYRFGKRYALTVDAFLSPNYLISSKTFLKEWGGAVGLATVFGGDWPYLKLSAVFKRRESSTLGAANQSVGGQVEVGRNFFYRKRPLDVTPTLGTNISITHSQYFTQVGSTLNYFSTIAELDQFIPTPWAIDHAFYVSARFGYTEGNLLFNSFFQGGGELLFSQARGFFLNRGFLPGTFLGRKMASLTTEYRFPITRVERGIGLLPAYLKTISAALVADTTTRTLGSRLPGDPTITGRSRFFEIYYVSAGVELITDWTVGYYLPTRARLGAYHGFGPVGEDLYITFGLQASL